MSSRRKRARRSAAKAKAKAEQRRESEAVDYGDFVEHPRYGRRPRITGSNPVQNRPESGDPWVKFHWLSSRESRIPNTAIEADISKQTITTMGVTHYFDELRTCQDCDAPFIFFAAEQKHWYEDLGFSLEANCIHCIHCRKKRQAIARMRERYEQLFHVSTPSDAERLEMAECCLGLVEAGVFSPRKTEHVRALLGRVSGDSARSLTRRLLAVEASSGAGSESEPR